MARYSPSNTSIRVHDGGGTLRLRRPWLTGLRVLDCFLSSASASWNPGPDCFLPLHKEKEFVFHVLMHKIIGDMMLVLGNQ